MQIGISGCMPTYLLYTYSVGVRGDVALYNQHTQPFSRHSGLSCGMVKHASRGKRARRRARARRMQRCDARERWFKLLPSRARHRGGREQPGDYVCWHCGHCRRFSRSRRVGRCRRRCEFVAPAWPGHGEHVESMEDVLRRMARVPPHACPVVLRFRMVRFRMAPFRAAWERALPYATCA